MQQDQIALLEKWLEDESFRNWAKRENIDDSQYWEEWLIQHPEYHELAEVAAQIVKGIRFRKNPVSTAKSTQALEQVLQRISANSTTSLNKSVGSNKSSFIYRYRLQIAASVALLICAGVFLYLQIAVFPYEVLQTDFGEKREFVLPDQTEVILNANSRLRYTHQNPRKVWLEGEAFFQVKKKPDTNEKFLVFTDDLTVEVLGTIFNVNSRNKKTKVFLEEGKVKLNLNNEEKSGVMLSPGDLLTYSAKQKKHYEKTRSETELHTSWKDGVLSLKATPLAEVIEQVEALYGISITLKNDSLRQRKINVAIPIDSLSIALASIEGTLNLHITQKSSRNYQIE